MSSQELTPSAVERAQRLITRIQGISSCRIAVTDGGAVAEVHVVATGGKSPKLVARDVESCLKAELGIDVDHRKIGVVMMQGEEEPEPEVVPAPTATPPLHVASSEDVHEFPIEEIASRFVFHSVNVFSERFGVRAEVELSRDDVDAFGASQSGNTMAEPLGVIAEATLGAIAEFLDDHTRLCLGGVRKTKLGDDDAVVVRIDVLEPRASRSLAGCSIVSGSEHQSVVFATLDAVNRVVGKLEFKSSVEYRIK